jgi:hypothetical protein
MKRVPLMLGLAVVGALWWTAPVAAQDFDPDDDPPVIHGDTEVRYRDGERFGTTTYIQSGSAFLDVTGGDAVPCQFTGFVDEDGDGEIDDVNGDGVVSDADFVIFDSYRWRFREVTEGALTSFDDIVAIAALAGISVEEALENYGPIEEAGWRRFEVACGGLSPSGGAVFQHLGFTLVPPSDSFWGIANELGELFDEIAWPTVASESLPREDTFGGLPVNMPASFSIGAAQWDTFVSPLASYRGWTHQLVVAPRSLRFVVTFDPDDGPVTTEVVDCLVAGDDFAVTDDGQMPARWDDVLEFATPGHAEWPCVWIPPSPGEVSVVAQVTYSVTGVTSGPPGVFTDSYAAEVRSSAPMQRRVDTLRAVNVTPGWSESEWGEPDDPGSGF